LAFPPHYVNQRYCNPGAAKPRGLGSVLKWMLTSRRETSPNHIPVRTSVPPASIDQPSLLTTCVNHSTYLLQQPGCNILTDPIWSERCSPVSFIGPHRHRLPGVEFERLPAIHIVLLSHNHYDHLDLPTLRLLVARGSTTFVAPLGVGPFLEARGMTPAHQLDWGESVTIGGVTIHAVPAAHFSGRSLFDRDRTLWCGYVIESVFGKIYVAGDTGFGPHFAAIRERHGTPRLALLPIGSSKPEWFMSPVHMSPEQAVEAHRVLGSALSIPIHHGTFQLGDDAVDTPAQRLRECAPEGTFSILENGQSLLIPQ
jgi:L-ascorbate metabolism protein UlaG (beta-lactamase superfamily)